jgi:hypothetical protein
VEILNKWATRRVLIVATIALGSRIFAQDVFHQDWRALAKRYSVLGDMFLSLEADGYFFDVKSAESKTINNLFLLTAIPVPPPSNIKADDRYFATPQPTAGLVTSVIDSRKAEVIPTEAVIVYAKLFSPDSIEFKGRLANSRLEVLYGFFNTKDMLITMKRNSMMLAKAAEQLQEKDKCFDQLYKGEAQKCTGPIRLGCAIASYIYSYDQCRTSAKR